MGSPVQPLYTDVASRSAEKRRLFDVFMKQNAKRLNDIASRFYQDNSASDMSDDELQDAAEQHARASLSQEFAPTLEAHLNRASGIASEPDRDPEQLVGGAEGGTKLPLVRRSKGT